MKIKCIGKKYPSFWENDWKSSFARSIVNRVVVCQWTQEVRIRLLQRFYLKRGAIKLQQFSGNLTKCSGCLLKETWFKMSWWIFLDQICELLLHPGIYGTVSSPTPSLSDRRKILEEVMPVRLVISLCLRGVHIFKNMVWEKVLHKFCRREIKPKGSIEYGRFILVVNLEGIGWFLTNQGNVKFLCFTKPTCGLLKWRDRFFFSFFEILFIFVTVDRQTIIVRLQFHAWICHELQRRMKS